MPVDCGRFWVGARRLARNVAWFLPRNFDAQALRMLVPEVPTTQCRYAHMLACTAHTHTHTHTHTRTHTRTHSHTHSHTPTLPHVSRSLRSLARPPSPSLSPPLLALTQTSSTNLNTLNRITNRVGKGAKWSPTMSMTATKESQPTLAHGRVQGRLNERMWPRVWCLYQRCKSPATSAARRSRLEGKGKYGARQASSLPFSPPLCKRGRPVPFPSLLHSGDCSFHL
jgi:hypothetical protein